jgi:hypothetical protein
MVRGEVALVGIPTANLEMTTGMAMPVLPYKQRRLVYVQDRLPVHAICL